MKGLLNTNALIWHRVKSEQLEWLSHFPGVFLQGAEQVWTTFLHSSARSHKALKSEEAIRC